MEMKIPISEKFTFPGGEINPEDAKSSLLMPLAFKNKNFVIKLSETRLYHLVLNLRQYFIIWNLILIFAPICNLAINSFLSFNSPFIWNVSWIDMQLIYSVFSIIFPSGFLLLHKDYRFVKFIPKNHSVKSLEMKCAYSFDKVSKTEGSLLEGKEELSAWRSFIDEIERWKK